MRPLADRYYSSVGSAYLLLLTLYPSFGGDAARKSSLVCRVAYVNCEPRLNRLR